MKPLEIEQNAFHTVKKDGMNDAGNESERTLHVIEAVLEWRWGSLNLIVFIGKIKHRNWAQLLLLLVRAFQLSSPLVSLPLFNLQNNVQHNRQNDIQSEGVNSKAYQKEGETKK